MAKKRKKQDPRRYVVPGGSKRRAPKKGKLIDLAKLKKLAEDFDSTAGQLTPRGEGD